MIDRLEILVSRLRHFASRNRWSARILGADPVIGHADEPGLVLIQIDGLGEQVFRRAVAEGKLPFVRHLLADDGYEAHALYSGMASNTPCFQAELFYGVPGIVPGFGFVDRELGRAVAMTQPAAAAAVERRLEERAGPGLLAGGSAWSDIYAGGAKESHFCSATAGLNLLLRALQPFRLIGLVLWHGWSVVRVAANLLAETALAIADFVRGTIAGRHFLQELRFIPERVLITAVLREIVTAGACVDADRGLPVVHLNLLGYDEHAHRRGPDSGFAFWTLRGIDRTIQRVWLAAHRSRHRDYQVWIYSDHGQERVQSYTRRYGEDVTDAIRRCWTTFTRDTNDARESPPPPPRRERAEFAEPSDRSRYIADELPEWWKVGHVPRGETAETVPEGEPTIVHKGPIGFVYLPPGLEEADRDTFAARVAREAHVPTVLVATGDGGADVWTSDGKEVHLPGDDEEILGPDHPHAGLVTEDLLRLVHHPDAGDLMLLTWHPDGALSFKIENGAHGGPGPRETTPFLVVPPETSAHVPHERPMRPSDLRELALDVLHPSRSHLPRKRPREPGDDTSIRFRIMTYNVHGCRGMDGRYSVERISRVIAREQPDVICLQEIDQSRRRSGNVDQAQEIASRLAADFHFHAVREVDDGRFGDAILTGRPIRVVKAGALPRLETHFDFEDRGVLWVEVDLQGRAIQILNTHLSIAERERRLQADALLEQWLDEEACRGPVLLAGDFNATADSYTGRRLTGRLHDVSVLDESASDPGLATWSGRLPLRRIDHIFASEHFRVTQVRVPRTRLTRTASDHLPLVVDLECRRDRAG